ncbi:MAG TPA: SDR family NAD(P)-dependent oxidoreductase [Candidatus Polarisedimenticolia bacterium]|nr:SDR family NAD(P)-dependent oxidoreductase [Candidatus Polarisedimenticolia bacterium]
MTIGRMQPTAADRPPRLEEIVVSLPGTFDPGLPIAAARAGATGLLDLQGISDPETARAALGRLVDLARGGRIGAVLSPAEDAIVAAAASILPDDATFLLALDEDADLQDVVARLRRGTRRVGAIVHSVEDLERAEARGFDVAAARGLEAGGRVGDETTFVLLQRLSPRSRLPLFAWGGIGWHTAAACVVGGASGIVLDWQLALLRESPLPAAMRRRVERMDGSETATVRDPSGGLLRLFARPGFTARDAIERLAESLRTAPAAAWREGLCALLNAPVLEERLWLMGQDASFAASFRREGESVGRVLPALRARVAAALAGAAASRALDSGAPLARSHGTTYPIVQGPMTRVSDVPAFIDAVERGGALPVLALALMREEPARRLLRETRARLEGRPFGVGILGFVPRELREEQLRAIHDAPPPFAIIAGGRPDQAASLEARGIATYLHVPSPGMLETFVRDGARRFIFEGSECGGHIGPRTSFILWETMVRVLVDAALPRAEAEKVHVLFGGGIHDALSGAMVAALSEPLVGRGMKVGVDVGTAYLFTEEAVASGAIVPAFQDVAMEADRTILVETGPGHAIRCAPTEFFSAFEAEKVRLRREGVPGEEIRERLEALNMGRLRIASKGIVRTTTATEAADPFRAVDEGEQRREGMYMLGQVAALHHERTTIPALHERIGRGSAELLAAFAARPEIVSTDERPAGPPPLDIALVGIACLLPGGAHDVATFWENIVQGKDAIGEIPPHRFDASLWFDADRKRRDHIYSKWGGFLEDLPFDPLKYGIPPAALRSIEPLQLLALEMVDQALRDAGYDRVNPHKARTAVILGVGGGAAELGGRYAFRSMLPRFFKRLPEEFLSELPEWTEDSFPGILLNVVAGRIANRFDLGGVNFTVDAACASSLAAIYLAARELATGACDLAIAGGCDTVQNPFGYLCFSKTGALSPRGRSRTFDASADGIAISEGHAAVVLKRRTDAERDGDRIYAVLRGAAGGSDGRVMGLTAPHEAGQIRTLERAYDQAGFSPATVGLFEAHGTGTVVGDQTECRALASLLDAEGAAPQSVAIGSVKSMIGHTKCTAGVAGLIKTALALHHRLLPPTLHVETPNPKAGFPGGPLYVSSVLRPWLRGAHPRRAGVSAFGFGGSNFHAVLEEYDGDVRESSGRDATRRGRPAELFLLAAATPAELASRARALQRDAAKPATDGRVRTIADVACAQHARDPRPSGAARAAVVAADIDSLTARLERLAARLEGTAAVSAAANVGLEGANADELRAHGIFLGAAGPGTGGNASVSIACLLAGPNGGVADPFRDLAIEFTEVADAFEEAAAGVASLPAAEFLKALFPPPWLDAEATRLGAECLRSPEVAAAAARAAGRAMTELLSAFGLAPAAVESEPTAAVFVALHDRGVRTFVDASPRGTLLLGGATALGDRPHTMVSLQNAAAGGWTSFLTALAGLWAAGAPLDPERLYVGEARAVDPHPRRAPWPAHSSHLFMLNGTSLRPASQPQVVEAPRFFLSPGDPAAPSAEATPAAARDVPAASRPASPIAPEAGAAAGVPSTPYAQFQATMRLFLETQARVMGSFLDDAGAPGMPVAEGIQNAVPAPTVALASAPIIVATPAPTVAAAPAPAAEAAPEPAPAPDGSRLREELLRIVSERTGYPAGMLTDDANLEADLGIDSIKRVEIIAAFRRTVLPSMTEPPPDYMERMTAARTLRAILAGSEAFFPRAAAPASHSAAPWQEAAAAPAPPAGPDRAEMARLLREIIAERTGYPVEMLADEANLEADLGIDSIKRVEIIAAFRRTILPDLKELPASSMERMAAARTAATIVREMAGLVGGGATTAAPAATTTTAAAAAAVAEAPGDEDCPRTVPRPVELPPVSGERAPLRPGCVLLTDDGGGVAAAVARRLVASDHPVALLSEADLRDAESVRGAVAKARGHASGIAALLHLAPLADAPSFPGIDAPTWSNRQDIEVRGLLFLVQALRPEIQDAAAAPIRVLAATRGGGDFSDTATTDEAGQPWRGGVAGMLKVAAREFEHGWFRAVDFDVVPDADRLLAELATPGPVEVGVRAGRRLGLEAVAAPLPDGPRLDEPSGAAALQAPDVVLVTGGARGITAEVAIEIAANSGATMILLGRTPPPPADEPEATAAHATPGDLRKALLDAARRLGAQVTPKEIEARMRRILADREIRATLAAIVRAGARAEYAPCDVSDPADLERVARTVLAQHGHIDAVVHGAGVIEDRFIADKTAESFDRVVGTKTSPLLTLTRLVEPRSLKLLLLFSSTSGFFGNAGQVDYAAANEILNRIARRLKGRGPARVVALNWGPWSGAGMVTPEVAKQFRERGVGMVTVPAGRAAAWREIARPDGPVRVLLGPGAWNEPARARARTEATPDSTRREVARDAASSPATPLLERQTVRRSGDGGLEARVVLDPARHPYLDHHRIDGKPVLPLAVAMELMTETAAAAAPSGWHVTHVLDVRMFSGVLLENGAREIAVTAARENGHGAEGTWRVRIADPKTPGRKLYEALVRLAEAPPAPPAAPSLPALDAACEVSVAEAYDRWTFHGPSLQVIEALRRVDVRGIDAVVRPSSPQKIAGASSAGWLIDAAMLDAGPQIATIWSRYHQDVTVLPNRIACYHRYGPLAGPPAEVLFRVSTGLDGQTYKGDVWYLRDGRVLGRIEGLEGSGTLELNRITLKPPR